MSVFRFPYSHNASITQSSTFDYLNPPSKASEIAVALFQDVSCLFSKFPIIKRTETRNTVSNSTRKKKHLRKVRQLKMR